MKKILSIITVIILFSIKSYSSPYYIGVGMGFNMKHDTYTQSNEAADNYYTQKPQPSKYSIDIYAGYNINRYLSIEGEYDGGIPYKNDSSNHTYKNTSQSGFVNFIGKYPILIHHIPFVKVGLGYEVNTDLSSNKPDEDNSVTKGFTYKIGIGYEYAITNHHSLVAEYDFLGSPKLNCHNYGYQNYYYNYGENFDNTYKDIGSYMQSNIVISYKYTF